MALTNSDVRQLVKDLDVKFVRLQFTDILGVGKNVAIPIEQLDDALAGDIMFDGSSIEGFVRIEESDMLLKPDPNTFAIYPWRPKQGSTARLICDIHNPDGTPFTGCPRLTLKRALAKAEQMGFTFNVGPEPEFYLFERDSKGKATVDTNDQAGYFDLSPVDLGEHARRDIVMALQEMGFEIEASHHEVGPGQHEIDFKYANALTTADRIATFRLVVRTVAMHLGLHATFMPKPIAGIAGSGMHLHQSLFSEGQNAFYDPKTENQLSKTALHYIGGLMKHAAPLTAITNPLVNSYKRLVPGFEAPVYIAWSERNRSPLIRIPARRGEGTRVELRNPDPSCNPYLALAVTLVAGLDGIENGIQPPAAVNANIYRMSKEDRLNQGIENLPENLRQALDALKGSGLIQKALGEHIFTHFLRAKEIEWDLYRKQVHAWELEQYLKVF